MYIFHAKPAVAVPALLGALVLAGCGHTAGPEVAKDAGEREPVPEFARELINSQTEREVSAIWRFRLDGETVYYVQSGCCDIFNDLYDQNGKRMCSPDGGITGDGDGKCPTFWAKAKHRVVVWEQGPVK